MHKGIVEMTRLSSTICTQTKASHVLMLYRTTRIECSILKLNASIDRQRPFSHMEQCALTPLVYLSPVGDGEGRAIRTRESN